MISPEKKLYLCIYLLQLEKKVENKLTLSQITEKQAYIKSD